MSKIVWDNTSERLYETGVDRGVLYPWVPASGQTAAGYGTGVAWNGLINVSESPSGAEPTPIYADNIKYLNLMSKEEFGGTIEAYTYPDEFGKCDGSAAYVPGINISQQKRTQFGLTYRTKIGNDTDGDEHGYKIHIVYGCLASPSERSYGTVNESPEAITFSWTFTTTPIDFPGFKPTSHVEIDSTKVDGTKLTTLENWLYGTNGEGQEAGTAPQLALPSKIAEIFGPAAG